MEKSALKHLTIAHSWLGLIISAVLYIVFLAGSFSFFVNDLAQWELGAHYPSQQNEFFISPQQLLDNNLLDKKIDANERVWLRLATNTVPIYDLMYSYLDEQGESQSPDPMMHAVTGEYIYNFEDMSIGRFFRQLHINLFIPEIGSYLVGLVTLFFLVVLISGILIHWRKLFSNFFQFRLNRSRDKKLDSHNIIGVMSLPFHLLFAITGVIFNLAIIVNATTTYSLFDGDEEAFQQVRFYTPPSELNDNKRPSGNYMDMNQISALIIKSQQDIRNYTVTILEIDHWQHDNASITFWGHVAGDFAKETMIQYRMKDGKVLYKNTQLTNSHHDGVYVMDKLHYGDFGGLPLKLIFFLLGLGTCYVIISGNLLWIEKQQKSRQHSTSGLKLVKNLSSAVFAGSLIATAICFIVTRLLPISITDKADILSLVFYITLLVCLFYTYLISSSQQALTQLLKFAALCFILVPIIDWYLLSDGIIAMLTFQRYPLIVVQVLCLLTAGICLLMAKHLRIKDEKEIHITLTNSQLTSSNNAVNL